MTTPISKLPHSLNPTLSDFVPTKMSCRDHTPIKPKQNLNNAFEEEYNPSLSPILKFILPAYPRKGKNTVLTADKLEWNENMLPVKRQLWQYSSDLKLLLHAMSGGWKNASEVIFILLNSNGIDLNETMKETFNTKNTTETYRKLLGH